MRVLFVAVNPAPLKDSARYLSDAVLRTSCGEYLRDSAHHEFGMSADGV